MSTAPAKISRKRLLASVGGGALLCAAGVTAWYCWPKSVPSPAASPSVLAKFASTEQFADMHYQQQQPYVDVLEHMNILALIKAADDAGMNNEERMRAVQNVINSRQERVMTEYFKVAAGPERVAYMDKIIDEIERSPIRPAGTGPKLHRMTAQEQKRRGETLSPDRQMQVMQFYTDMLTRREQRGLKNATSLPKH